MIDQLTTYPAAVETPVDQLTISEQNPRRIEPAKMRALKASMTKDREMLAARPVLALPDGRVIGGNQRLAAAIELGWETIPCIRVDLDEERAREWMVRDNNSFGEWDYSLLTTLLTRERESKDQLANLGFSTTDIRKIVANIPKDETSELGEVRPRYHVRIDCESEEHQLGVLEELSAQGLDVHALLAYEHQARHQKAADPIPDREGQIELKAEIKRTPRVMQVEGMFDLSPQKQDGFRISAALPLSDRPWNIGLIVGPSGSGKTTVARHLFSDPASQWSDSFAWDADGAVVDGFPEMPISELGELLSSVGFSSPRAWLRPFHTLSNGEQFRVTVARALSAQAEVTVVDEFTSVVDRTVAQIASSAVARAIRSRGQRFVAVSCHEDILEWLQPDWVYRPSAEEFTWRSLQRRPEIEIIVRRSDTSFWPIFRQYHYLSHTISSAAECFVGFYQGVPVTFYACNRVFGHPLHRVGSRLVCHPDYQGVGIGTRFSDYCAGLLTGLGLSVHSVSSHPARAHHNADSPVWRMIRAPSLAQQQSAHAARNFSAVAAHSATRLTSGFVYCGPRLPKEEAQRIFSRILHLEKGHLSFRQGPTTPK